MILAYRGVHPQLAEGVFIAPGATVAGRVRIGAGSGVWFSSVVRGDTGEVEIGERTNIQDGAIVHTFGELTTRIGDDVTIGHGAVVHAAQIGDAVLIGMGASVLNRATVGEQCIIAAHALVGEGASIPPRSLVVGVPGKVVRALSDKDLSLIARTSETYVELARAYSEGLASH
jgi:carbonic anhydrase/acetyltransferase-like protein (isoleucine patch superfamily)